MSSLLTPHLAEAAPDLARMVPWFLVLGAFMLIGTVAAAVSLMRFRARLTVAEARRIAETTSFRELHRGMVRARRLVIGGALLCLAGVLVAWASGVLTQALVEFFVVAVGAGAFGPACFAVAVLEAMYRLVADRFDDLLPRPSTGSPT